MTRTLSSLVISVAILSTCPLGCFAENPPPIVGGVAVGFIPNDFQRLDQPPGMMRDWVGCAGVLLDGSMPSALVAWIEYFQHHISLVSIDTGTVVPGEVIPAVRTIAGGDVTSFGFSPGWAHFSFVPDAPLADGWYVLVVDVSGTPQPVIFGGAEPIDPGGHLYGRRLQVGPASHWYESVVDCTRAYCHVEVGWTGPVDALGGTTFELRGGDASGCMPFPVEAPAYGVAWACYPIASGTELEVRLVDEGAVVSLPGAPRSQAFVVDPNTSLRMPIAPDFGFDVVRSAL